MLLGRVNLQYVSVSKCHLKPIEREQIDKIKGDLDNYRDIIIDHGYTGPIKKDTSLAL